LSLSSYTIVNKINYNLKFERKSLAIGAIHYNFEDHSEFDRCDHLTCALLFKTVGEKQHGSVRKSCALVLSSLYYMKFAFYVPVSMHHKSIYIKNQRDAT
jgi:hypothetical protein